jgi:hypothetical protein
MGGGVAIAEDGSPLFACAIPAGRATREAASMMARKLRFRIWKGPAVVGAAT